MLNRISINDEFEIINGFDDNQHYVFKCLRYGEDYRDIDSDPLIIAMLHKIQKLEDDIQYFL